MYLLLFILYNLNIIILIYLTNRFICFDRFIYQTIFLYRGFLKIIFVRYIQYYQILFSLFQFGFNWFGIYKLNKYMCTGQNLV